jgi:prolyl oligopeptidase
VTPRTYPAVLFTTGANDPRVAPWHSRKMTAALQAANAADTPILLRTSQTSGHGIGTALSEQIDEYTDVFAFLFDELGVSPREAATSQPEAAQHEAAQAQEEQPEAAHP